MYKTDSGYYKVAEYLMEDNWMAITLFNPLIGHTRRVTIKINPEINFLDEHEAQRILAMPIDEDIKKIWHALDK